MVTGLMVFTRGSMTLERIEGPDPKLLDRGGIGDPQRGKPDQQRKAQQPGIANRRFNHLRHTLSRLMLLGYQRGGLFQPVGAPGRSNIASYPTRLVTRLTADYP